MHNITRALGLPVTTLVLIALPACGDDDGDSSGDGASSTTSEVSADSTETGSTEAGSADSDSGNSGDSAFPNDEFCDAVADFSSAQDGAQRNQALGDMAAAAGADIPPAITQALDNLDTGDLPAEAYAAAEQALTAVCN